MPLTASGLPSARKPAMTILEEILEDQMKFIEAAGKFLAKNGQDFIDDACKVNNALQNFLASLNQPDDEDS